MKSLIHPLGDGAEWEGDPALVADKELGEADIVSNERGDDTKTTAGLGCVYATSELACNTTRHPISPV